MTPMGDLEQTPDIATLWAEVMAWLGEHAPGTAAVLRRSGPPREFVRAVQQDSELDWPDELLTWFALHDGGGNENLFEGMLFPRFVPLSASDAGFRRREAVLLGSRLAEQLGPEAALGVDSAAGDDVSIFLPEFVPVATDSGYGYIVVDLRPGPRRGAVTTYSYETGTAHGSDGHVPTSWANLTSMIVELRDALVTGSPFMGCTARVDEVGELMWVTDPQSFVRLLTAAVTRGWGSTFTSPGAFDPAAAPDGLMTSAELPWTTTSFSVFGGSRDGPGDHRFGATPEDMLRMTGADEIDLTMTSDYDGPDLTTVWSMMRAWIDENAPATSLEMSSAGSTAAEVAAAEATTGLVWTDELRTWFTLHSGVTLSHGSPFLAGYYVPDLRTAIATRTTALEIQSSVWADPDYGLGDETDDDDTDRGDAGTGSFGFDPSFVIIGDAHARAEMVVDLRPGPLHGCVMAHEWEDGGATRPDLGWPSIAAMLWDHLEALRGRPSARLLGADPVVSDAGHLEWTFGV
jgi:cell wall assembly regulator SMI1